MTAWKMPESLLINKYHNGEPWYRARELSTLWHHWAVFVELLLSTVSGKRPLKVIPPLHRRNSVYSLEIYEGTICLYGMSFTVTLMSHAADCLSTFHERDSCTSLAYEDPSENPIVLVHSKTPTPVEIDHITARWNQHNITTPEYRILVSYRRKESRSA